MPLAAERELRAGDTFSVAQVVVTLESDVAESDVLSEGHQLFDETSTIVKSIIATRSRATRRRWPRRR